jgi:hypothetical protein
MKSDIKWLVEAYGGRKNMPLSVQIIIDQEKRMDALEKRVKELEKRIGPEDDLK